jgi:membrane-associated phospholipid phosphatase
VRSSEWLALSYAAYLIVAAWLRSLPAMRRWSTALGAVAMGAASLAAARWASAAVRDWLPVLNVVAAYYLSARLFIRPSEALESWLVTWDRRILGDPQTRFASWPRPIIAFLEVSYMSCFALLPAGFALLVVTGHAAAANRYWTLVEGAEFGAFAPLAFFQTRPPWILEQTSFARAGAARQAGGWVVRNLSSQANTFPSGHVAGSLAVAFGLLGVLPGAGLVCLAFAASISLACIVGRYHYVVDVLAGAILAISVWAAVLAL